MPATGPWGQPHDKGLSETGKETKKDPEKSEEDKKEPQD